MSPYSVTAFVLYKEDLSTREILNCQADLPGEWPLRCGQILLRVLPTQVNDRRCQSLLNRNTQSPDMCLVLHAMMGGGEVAVMVVGATAWVLVLSGLLSNQGF